MLSMRSKQNKLNRSWIIYLFSVLMITGCIDPIDPGLPGTLSETDLVVSGFITNEDQPHRVVLSRSRPLNTRGEIEFETGATVEVVDSNNNRHQLTEVAEGQYATNPVEFRSQVGESYQLRITLQNGEEFESDFQQLLPAIPMENLRYERNIRTELERDFEREQEFIDIVVDVDLAADPEYATYEYRGTYETEVTFQGNPFCWVDPALVPVDLEVGLVCYIFEWERLPLNIVETPDPILQDATKAIAIPIELDFKFLLGYQMDIIKANLTESYFEFLKELKGQQNLGGSIFDAPPTEIVGNVRNINNPNRPALGYFSTQAITIERIFIPEIFFEETADRHPINETLVPPRPDNPACCDCRLLPGAFTQQPDDWGN